MVGIAWIVKHLGQTKEVGAYGGSQDRDKDECENVDQAEEAGSAAGPEPGWAAHLWNSA